MGQQFDDLGAQFMTTTAELQTGAISQEQAMSDIASEVNTTKQKVIDYGSQIGLLPDDVETVLKLIDNGQIDEAERKLQLLTATRTLRVNLITGGASGQGGSMQTGNRASGGPVAAGGLYRVNESGTEMLSVGGKDYLMMGNQSGSVTPNTQLGVGAATVVHNYNTTINSSRADPERIASAITKYNRRNGKR